MLDDAFCLRSWRPADADMYVELAQDRDVERFLFPYDPGADVVPSECEVIRRGRLVGFHAAIVLTDRPGVAVGRIDVWETDTAQATVQLAVLPAHRGRGAASAALRQAVSFVFGYPLPSFDVIYGEVDKANVGSRRAVLAAGFTELPNRHPRALTDIFYVVRPDAEFDVADLTF